MGRYCFANKNDGGREMERIVNAYVISSLQTYLFQFKELGSNALSVIKDIRKLVSVVNQCISFYPKRDQIDVSFQEKCSDFISSQKPKTLQYIIKNNLERQFTNQTSDTKTEKHWINLEIKNLERQFSNRQPCS